MCQTRTLQQYVVN